MREWINRRPSQSCTCIYSLIYSFFHLRFNKGCKYGWLKFHALAYHFFVISVNYLPSDLLHFVYPMCSVKQRLVFS